MNQLCVVLLLFFTVFSVVENRTIRWTSAGGTALWDYDRNWDTLSVPTENDDVIIDLPNIPGSVRIAATPAVCKSLTVGGSSQFPQSLYIQGSLTVGTGGAVINPNGDITLDSSPATPLVSNGIFSGSNRFTFVSGTLDGKGQFIFESLNMSTAALKQINAATTVRGNLAVLPGAGQSGLISITLQSLQVLGNLHTSESITISSDDTKGASLDVKGSVTLAGPGKDFIIRGYAFIDSLYVKAGRLSIQNAIDVSNTIVSSGGSVALIGGPENKRNFVNISGDGVFSVQGGQNSIKKVDDLNLLELVSGTITSDGAITATNLQLSGGEIKGKVSVSASKTSITTTTVTSASIRTTSLDVKSPSTLAAGASLTLTGTGVVSAAAQFTLDGGSSFVVASSASLSQADTFAIVPGADPTPPTLRNDGTWTSSAATNINVNTAGTGTWIFKDGSSLSSVGVTFSTNVLNVLSSATFLGVTGTYSQITGSGTVSVNGQSHTINSANSGSLNILNGDVNIASGSISDVKIDNGNLNVGTKVTFNNFNFNAGTVAGAAQGSVLLTTTTKIAGENPKFLKGITVLGTVIDWDCAGGSCQIVSNNAVLKNLPPSTTRRAKKH